MTTSAHPDEKECEAIHNILEEASYSHPAYLKAQAEFQATCRDPRILLEAEKISNHIGFKHGVTWNTLNLEEQASIARDLLAPGRHSTSNRFQFDPSHSGYRNLNPENLKNLGKRYADYPNADLEILKELSVKEAKLNASTRWIEEIFHNNPQTYWRELTDNNLKVVNEGAYLPPFKTKILQEHAEKYDIKAADQLIVTLKSYEDKALHTVKEIFDREAHVRSEAYLNSLQKLFPTEPVKVLEQAEKSWSKQHNMQLAGGAAATLIAGGIIGSWLHKHKAEADKNLTAPGNTR